MYSVNALTLENKNVDLQFNNNEIKEIYTDPVRISQILFNLVGNAIKFTKEGKITVNINEEDKYYKFSVTDTGIGIKKELLKSIFESFTIGETGYKKKYDGTGLGLSICKRLVDLLGGKIWVESKVNQGSTFYFTIPVEK